MQEIVAWVTSHVDEIIQIYLALIGLASLIFGTLLLVGIGIGTQFKGFVGVIAIFPALFILLDYIAKNKK